MKGNEKRIQHRAEFRFFFLIGLRKDLFGEGLVKARLIICVISDSSVNIRRDYKGGKPTACPINSSYAGVCLYR